MEYHDIKLIKFARKVLSILEEQKEWNSDTLADIAYEAEVRSLGQYDEHLMFKANFKS